MQFSYSVNNIMYNHSPTGASISLGLGVSKRPGPGFPYYSRKAGSTEIQKRNTGCRMVEGQVISQMKALAEKNTNQRFLK